jgi:hypothetical protein
MRRMLIATVVSFTAAALSGCAGYRLTPITPDQARCDRDSQPEGYVFYAPKPYLLGLGKTGDSGTVFEFEVVYLPDQSKPYRFTRYELFAKSDLNITFEDGWKFTGAESKTDSTPALTALAGLANAALPGIFADRGKPADVLLWEINTDGSGDVLDLVYPASARP